MELPEGSWVDEWSQELWMRVATVTWKNVSRVDGGVYWVVWKLAGLASDGRGATAGQV